MDKLIKKIEEQRERMQHDLLTQLDGLEEEFLNGVCDMIVDRMNELIHFAKCNTK